MWYSDSARLQFPNRNIQDIEEHAEVDFVSEYMIDTKKAEVKQKVRYLNGQCFVRVAAISCCFETLRASYLQVRWKQSDCSNVLQMPTSSKNEIF